LPQERAKRQNAAENDAMSEMRQISLGAASGFADPGRRVIEVDGREIGVFRLKGEFRAYENVCPHMGGPVCQGRINPRVSEDIAADGRSRGLVFSTTATNVACPWHGYEFDILTGRHQGDARLRLRPVRLRIVDGEVVLLLPL
jgi:nitrite reductase/ring-hydroxylating ferredoxin subunit